MCEDCWGLGDKTTLCVTALAPSFLFTLPQAVTSKGRHANGAQSRRTLALTLW